MNKYGKVAGYKIYEWHMEEFKKHLDSIVFMTGNEINRIKKKNGKPYYLLPEELYKAAISLLEDKNREEVK